MRKPPNRKDIVHILRSRQERPRPAL